MKRWAVSAGLRALGALGPLLPGRGLFVCLHSVTGADADFAGPMAVSPEFLRALVISARAQNIAILSLSDALVSLMADPEKPFLCLTFDDGYRGVYTQAFRVFLELDVPFTIFLTSDFIDDVRPMWWDVVERLLSARSSVVIDGQVVSARSPTQKLAVCAELAQTFRTSPSCEHTRRLGALLAENSREPSAVLSGRALTWTMLEHMLASGLLTVGAHTVTHPVLASLSRRARAPLSPAALA